MMIFKKKNKQQIFRKIVDPNEDNSLIFKSRPLFINFRPVEYHIIDDFSQYKTVIDNYLEQQFNGEVDEYNGNTLDNLIIDIALQAIENLKNQQADHLHAIRDLDRRLSADKENLTLKLEEFIQSQKQSAIEKNELKKRYDQYKFAVDFNNKTSFLKGEKS